MQGWTNLESNDQVSNLLAQSESTPCVIFKHSTTCSISSIAQLRLNDIDTSSSRAKFYYIDLLTFRSVSNHIAEVLNVHHESPQIIIVKNQEATFDASHLDITHEELLEELNR